MTRILSIKLILLFIINIVSAQFISDHIDRTVPNNIHGQLDYSDMPLFSPDRFSFNQGFSMSMMSSGSKPTSIASYSNNVTYWASTNLKINANILHDQLRHRSSNRLPAITAAFRCCLYSKFITIYPMEKSLVRTPSNWLHFLFQIILQKFKKHQLTSAIHMQVLKLIN